MDIQKLIKKLKSIEADAAYTARSRHALVGGTQKAPRLTIFSYIGRALAEGSAIALAGALLIVIMAGFSTWEFLSPFELKSLDPAGLRAEAHAIDIQIQLTNLAYPDLPRGEAFRGVPHNESTTLPVAVEITSKSVKDEVRQEAQSLGLASATSSGETAPISIDDALDRLAE